MNDDVNSFYGIFSDKIEIFYVCRLILESCVDDDEIILDFSNLQYWDDDCIDKAIASTDEIEKTIVLVEGTSDKDILEFAMKKIYPHLSDLFYFMDFDDENGGKRDGGTSFLVKNLKTFYFSKLNSKFIAVFDNDAEGYQSKCTLMNDIKKWPSNFRILLYPEISFFNAYPTLAPNGTVVLDNINRKACSIELYLPNSIIMNEANFFPVEWEARKKVKHDGIEEALYQGVISQKEEIKQSFHSIKNAIEKNEKRFAVEEWDRMKILIDSIIFAFK